MRSNPFSSSGEEGGVMHRRNGVVAGTCELEEEEETCTYKLVEAEEVTCTYKLVEAEEVTCTCMVSYEVVVVGEICTYKLVGEGSKLVVVETRTYKASWVVEGTCICRVSLEVVVICSDKEEILVVGISWEVVVICSGKEEILAVGISWEVVVICSGKEEILAGISWEVVVICSGKDEMVAGISWEVEVICSGKDETVAGISWEVVVICSGKDETVAGISWEVASDLKADVTVCKEGSGCDYKTVQEAVNAAPKTESGKKFVIRIKEGTYEETIRVPFDTKNVVFLGDGMGKTVITGSLNVGQLGMTTYESATVGVLGDGFMASNLTFKNTAGPDAHQAVAFRSDSDLSVIENCEFLGNQDTLYAKSLRQFYKKCRIQGNVDFIFGNAAAIFQDCDILVAPRQLKPEHGEQNAVTAHGRTDPAQATGFVFNNCVIDGTEDYMKYYKAKPNVHRNYLGRPWKEYARTVFVNCTLESLISPEGWLPWNGGLNLKTLYYGEFGNSGPGSDTSKRVSWSSRIPADHVDIYSVKNFIQGDEWISSSS